MAKQVINNGDTGATVRASLNSNFSELYLQPVVNVAPDPFFRLHRAGRKFVDGYPITDSSIFTMSASAGSPFADNVVKRLGPGNTNENRAFDIKRLGLKAGSTVTVVVGIYAQQGISYSAFLRSSAGTVIATATGGTQAFAGGGEYRELSLTFTIDTTLKASSVSLQMRLLVGQTSASTNIDVCGYGIFVNAPNASLLDSAFNNDDSRIRSLSHRAGLEFLPETRQRLGCRRLAVASNFDVGLFGDSYTHLQTRWSGLAATYLKSTFGNGGIGWVGFGYPSDAQFGLINGSIDGSITFSKTGTWTTAYATSDSPDLCSVTSVDYATPAVFKANGFASGLSAMSLLTIGSGVYAYSVDGGSTYSNIDVSAGGVVSTALTVPGTAFNLWIKPISGTVQFCGVNAKTSASGVRVHKLAATGSSALQWSAANAANFQAGVTSLNLNLCVVMLGANDQNSSTSFVNYRTYLDTLISRIKTALPLADVLLMAQPENQLGKVIPMAGYSEVARDIASRRQCAFVDLQSLYGQSPADYASTSARNWFNADNLHPDPANNGGVPICEEFIRILTAA